MKIAAIDFDGTIFFEDGISSADREAIRAWQDAGHLAVAATGKSGYSAALALNGTGLEFDYSLFSSGAALYDRELRLIDARLLDHRELASVINRWGGTDGLDIYGVTLEGIDVCFHKGFSGPQTTILSEYQMADYSLFEGELTAMAMWVPGNPELHHEVFTWVRDNTDVACLKHITFIDLIPEGATKGQGLRRLLTHLKVDRAEVELITLGDGHNDLSMHEIADCSIGFPWGPEDVTSKVDVLENSAAEALLKRL